VDQFLDMFTLANPVATTTPVATMLLSLLMACAIGQVMGWTYGSTAVAFGLLAVFAVVRFRNVLKDTRDTSFILWAIVEGMGVGTMHYTEAICGLLVVGGLIGYLWYSDFGSRQQFDATLSIDMGQTSVPLDETLAPILDRHAAKWKKAGNQQLTQLGSSIAYQLLLRDPSRSDELRNDLLQAEDVKQISLYVNDFQSET